MFFYIISRFPTHFQSPFTPCLGVGCSLAAKCLSLQKAYCSVCEFTQPQRVCRIEFHACNCTPKQTQSRVSFTCSRLILRVCKTLLQCPQIYKYLAPSPSHHYPSSSTFNDFFFPIIKLRHPLSHINNSIALNHQSQAQLLDNLSSVAHFPQSAADEMSGLPVTKLAR